MMDVMEFRGLRRVQHDARARRRFNRRYRGAWRLDFERGVLRLRRVTA